MTQELYGRLVESSNAIRTKKIAHRFLAKVIHQEAEILMDCIGKGNAYLSTSSTGLPRVTFHARHRNYLNISLSVDSSGTGGYVMIPQPHWTLTRSDPVRTFSGSIHSLILWMSTRKERFGIGPDLKLPEIALADRLLKKKLALYERWLDVEDTRADTGFESCHYWGREKRELVKAISAGTSFVTKNSMEDSLELHMYHQTDSHTLELETVHSIPYEGDKRSDWGYKFRFQIRNNREPRGSTYNELKFDILTPLSEIVDGVISAWKDLYGLHCLHNFSKEEVGV